jgi:hypothetical protein
MGSKRPWYKRLLGFGRHSSESPEQPLVRKHVDVDAPTPIAEQPPSSEWYRRQPLPEQQPTPGKTISTVGSVGVSNQGSATWIPQVPKSGGTDLQPVSPSSNMAKQQVVASKNSFLYHQASCEWAQLIATRNFRSFASSSEAESLGLSPCKKCWPSGSSNASRVNAKPIVARGIQVGVSTPGHLKRGKLNHQRSTAQGLPVTAQIGTRVTVEFRDGESMTFELVASGARVAGSNQFSVDSSLGKAIRGLRSGQESSYVHDGRFHYLKVTNVEKSRIS